MAEVVLVHGLGATEKSWFDIPERLEALEHRVTNVLLPSFFSSDLDAFVAEIVGALPTTEPAILVGHSMGGISISQTAARFPDRVSRLVYVAALVPKQGESGGSIIGGLSTSLDDVGTEFDQLGISWNHPARRFPALGALRGKFDPGNAFDNVPKHYIGCANDTIVTPQEQERMIAKWAFTKTDEIASGHIPQREKPNELMAVLQETIA